MGDAKLRKLADALARREKVELAMGELAELIGLPRVPDVDEARWLQKAKETCTELSGVVSVANVTSLHAAMDPKNPRWMRRVKPRHHVAWAQMARGLRTVDELRDMVCGGGMKKSKNAHGFSIDHVARAGDPVLRAVL